MIKSLQSFSEDDCGHRLRARPRAQWCVFVCQAIYFYAFWPRVHTKAIKRRFRIEKKKVFRKQRFIVLMRMGKKEDSQKCWLQSLWHVYRRNRRTLCMQASLRASSPGGAGMREGKGGDLIGQILTTQHQRSYRGFLEVEFKWMRRQCKLSLPFSLPHPYSFGRACSQAICRSKNAQRGKYRCVFASER